MTESNQAAVAKIDTAGDVMPARLLTIDVARAYAGGIPYSTFNKNWVPKLRATRAGKRLLIDKQSLDALIDEMLAKDGPASTPDRSVAA